VQIIHTIDEIRDATAPFRRRFESVGLVPTMGALHSGHLSLVRESMSRADRTVVSIFVNPTQFGPGEDLQAYPRPYDHDLELLEREGVDIAYLPSDTEMYPSGWSTRVAPPAVANQLEGQSRPGHFQGVCTVVLKLFLQILPDHAFFGQKDYQQVAVIRQMIRDLDVPVALSVCPTVREPDGLAMSSRNVYLSVDQRPAALGLYRALMEARRAVQQGEVDGHALMNEMRQVLIDSGVDSIDYAVVADPDTLDVLDQIDDRTLGLVACRVGTTRLIDNLWLTDPPAG